MFDKVFNLTTLNGKNGFTVENLKSGDRYPVSTVRDMNGDGLADIVFGAVNGTGWSSDKGIAYVIFGQSKEFPTRFDLSMLNGTNGFNVLGLNPSDHLGTSVSTAGDINGDGKSDLILGADGVNTYRGSAYVIFGQDKYFSQVFDLGTLDGKNGFAIPGLNIYAQFGLSVSAAGDMNGDGKADLIVGSPSDNERGAAYIIFGQENFPAQFNLSELNGNNGFKIPGLTKNDSFGTSVSGIGDMNGDGKADIVIGADRANATQGTVYVIFGQENFPANFNLTTLNGQNGFIVHGLGGSDYLGWSVSSAGDMNGDGKTDLVLGANNVQSGEKWGSGAAYVIFGQENFPPNFDLLTLDGKNGFTIPGGQVGSPGGVGSSVSTAGDMNGDGLADVIIAGRNFDVDRRTCVIFGQEKFPAQFNITTLNGQNGFAIDGLNAGYFSVNTAGDINNDGVSDIVLGAFNGIENRGVGYVIFGKFPLILNKNQMAIMQGQSITLNSENLNATDLNGFPNNLNFILFNIQGGRFAHIDNPETPIKTFTQQDIIDRKISFIQDTTPEVSYAVEVTNGAVSTKPVNATVNFKLAPPTLMNNQITIQQGKSIILTSENLSATDLNFPANTLIFNVRNIQGGRFEFLDNPNVSITNFTQQDIMDAKIQFVQDGSKRVGYEISVSDTNDLKTPPAAAQVNFIRVYQPPKLNNPIPDQSVKTNVPFNIEIPPNTFIDPDGDFNSNQLVYSASQVDGNPLPDWVSFANQSFSGAAPLMGNNRFSLFAANPANRSAVSSTNFSLSVAEASLSFWAIIYIGIGAGGGALLLITLGALLYCRKKETLLQSNPPTESDTLLDPPPTINPTDDNYLMDFRNLDSKHTRR